MEWDTIGLVVCWVILCLATVGFGWKASRLGHQLFDMQAKLLIVSTKEEAARAAYTELDSKFTVLSERNTLLTRQNKALAAQVLKLAEPAPIKHRTMHGNKP